MSQPAAAPARPQALRAYIGGVSAAGAPFLGAGFTSMRMSVGRYAVSFPAGMWSLRQFPVVVVTPLARQFAVATVEQLNFLVGGVASVWIDLRNGASDLIDANFLFNASAPLSAGATSGLLRPGMQRATLSGPAIRSSAHGRKGH